MREYDFVLFESEKDNGSKEPESSLRLKLLRLGIYGLHDFNTKTFL